MKRKLNVRARPAARAATAATATPAPGHPSPLPRRVFVDGRIVRMLPDGNVILRLRDKREIPCRRAAAIQRGWLAAALAIGPVEAEGTYDLDAGSGSIWCVFPGPEHAEAAAPTVDLVATERVSLRCGKTSVALEKDGSLQMRGRDILTRGSRSARLSGAIVRIN